MTMKILNNTSWRHCPPIRMLVPTLKSWGEGLSPVRNIEPESCTTKEKISPRTKRSVMRRAERPMQRFEGRNTLMRRPRDM